MLSTVYLAAEDQLGLAVGRRLIAEAPPLTIYREENGHGFGALKRKTINYQSMGLHMPVLMLTDLDNQPCAPSVISEWLGSSPNVGFLFRVCVREVEAWLLADRAAIASLLRIPVARIPKQPESVSDPKGVLIQLAQKAPTRLRAALTPIGTATIGPDYNALLVQFVMKEWNPTAAAQVAPSLARTRTRIAQLAALISD